MAPPSTINASPATLPTSWPAGDGALPPRDTLATSRNRSNFSTRKPNAMVATAVRTQARNVLSLAAWSP